MAADCRVVSSLQPESKVPLCRDNFSLNPLCVNGFDCILQLSLMRHGMSKPLRFEDKTRKNLLFEPKGDAIAEVYGWM